MPVTIAGIKVELQTRIGPFWTLAGLTATAFDGPIRWAVGRMDLETADTIDVADADLVDLTRTQYETLLYLAEYFALETFLGNYLKVDQSLGSESQSLSQRRGAIMERLAWLRKYLGVLVDPASVPGPSASGLIRAGRCYPGTERPYLRPWRGAWYGGRWCP